MACYSRNNTALASALCAIWTALLPAVAASPKPPQQGIASAAQIDFHALQQDTETAEVLASLKAHAPHGAVLFRNVQIVDIDAGTVIAGRAVLVSGQRISWIGDHDKAPTPAGLNVVDGGGRYLVPGL